jgi:uncharacterized protein (DUF1330 family)
MTALLLDLHGGNALRRGGGRAGIEGDWFQQHSIGA